MKRLLACAPALLGLFAANATAADPPAPSDSRTFLAKLNPFTPSKPASAMAATAAVPPAPSKPVGPLSSDTLLEVLTLEQDAYTRRLEVCMRLRKVAFDKNDDKMAAQADELERLAEITYKTRIARLGVKSNLRSNRGLDDLERSVGSRMTATPATAGVQSPNDGRPATAQLRNFREVKP